MTKIWFTLFNKVNQSQFVVPKNIHTSPMEEIFSYTTPPSPHLSGNSSQASYINLRFWAFESPSPPRNFQSLLWGEYGYFLELHSNVWRVMQYRNTINTLKSYGPTKVHL